LDSVHSTCEIASAFDVCECWSDEHEQDGNDADDDEQFEQRKSAGALTLFQRCEAWSN